MNLRKDNNGAALKAWKKLGPGHIAKPLRYIGNRTNGIDSKGRVVLSANFISARAAADCGHSQFVQDMARSLS